MSTILSCLIEKERNSIQEEIRKRENELKVNALREIELLKMTIINGDVEEKLIEHLSDVVTSVEEYANSRGSKQGSKQSYQSHIDVIREL